MGVHPIQDGSLRRKKSRPKAASVTVTGVSGAASGRTVLLLERAGRVSAAAEPGDRRSCGRSSAQVDCSGAISRNGHDTKDVLASGNNGSLIGDRDDAAGIAYDRGNVLVASQCGRVHDSRADNVASGLVSACLGAWALRLMGFGNCGLEGTRKDEAFGDLGANRVVLISRQSHSSQNTNDRHNDHQFDKGKAPLRGERSCERFMRKTPSWL
jgi:hypothetical protein